MASRAITPGGPAAGTQPQMPGARRKRRNTSTDDQNVRYFLLKPGSTLEKPELGEELTSIKQVLIRSFKSNQPFLTLMAWNAVEDTSDDNANSPMIVKQKVTRP
jgi:hypothetical protein